MSEAEPWHKAIAARARVVGMDLATVALVGCTTAPADGSAGTGIGTGVLGSTGSHGAATAGAASTGGGSHGDAGVGGSEGGSTGDGADSASTSASSESGTAMPEGVCAFTAWSFDGCPSDWIVGKGDDAAAAPSWACGAIVDRGVPRTPPHERGFHDGEMWATGLGSNFANDESSTLTSPAFSLADCGPAAALYLVLDHWWWFDYGCGGAGDGGLVQISQDDGASWASLEPYWHGYGGEINATLGPLAGNPGFCGISGPADNEYSGENAWWVTSLVDLAPFAGQDNLRVRLVLGSDDFGGAAGWFVDTVSVEGYQ